MILSAGVGTAMQILSSDFVMLDNFKHQNTPFQAKILFTPHFGEFDPIKGKMYQTSCLIHFPF